LTVDRVVFTRNDPRRSATFSERYRRTVRRVLSGDPNVRYAMDASQWAYPGDRPTYRFLVEDVDALYRELQDRGALPDPAVGGSPWARPGDTPWGTREFHVRDPSGNLLQFYRLLS
jgi:hypothetical protein